MSTTQTICLSVFFFSTKVRHLLVSPGNMCTSVLPVGCWPGSQRRLTSATWLALPHGGFNSALSPPRFGQKENHLSDIQPSHENNNSNLPHSSGH